MNRARLATIGLAVVAGGVLVIGSSKRSSGAATAPTTTVARETTKVVRKDLVQTEKLKGKLGYGTTSTITSSGQGLVTALPALGVVIGRGEPLYEVDGKPGPRLMIGTRPMWRELSWGVNDGADVRQLEENLVELGFGANDLVIDNRFDGATARAVERWQKFRAVEQTAVVGTGDLVFLPTQARVAEQKATLGSRAEGPILTVTGTDQTVTSAVTTDKLRLLSVGAAVTVELPKDASGNARQVAGTIGSISTVAKQNPGENGSEGTTTIDVTVTLSAPVDTFDAAPVTLLVDRAAVRNALTVPVRAIVALAEGGYALEKADASGWKLIAVKLGGAGDGVVQVIGDELAEGDTVVVAP